MDTSIYYPESGFESVWYYFWNQECSIRMKRVLNNLFKDLVLVVFSAFFAFFQSFKIHKNKTSGVNGSVQVISAPSALFSLSLDVAEKSYELPC